MPKTYLSTSLSHSAKKTQQRIRNLFQEKKKRPPWPVLTLAALVILLCGSLVSCQPKAETQPESSPTTSSFTLGQDVKPVADYSFSVQVSDGRTLTAVPLVQNPEDNYLSIEQIQIYDGDELIQVIDPVSIPPIEDYAWDGLFINRGYSVGEPDIRDMNFDGAEDFGLLAVNSYPQNIPYSYFLWNETNGCFDYGFTLFNSDGLEVDVEHRQLIEVSHDGMGQYTNYYEYAPDGSLRRIDSVEPNLPSPSDNTSSTPESQTSQTTQASQAPQNQNTRTAAYAAVLKGICDDLVFPDGDIYDAYHGDTSRDKFAIYDLDRDGADELIVLCSNTYMAGMTGRIYDFDEASGTVREEFSEFPTLTFYNNGIIRADWSHSQGWAGDFWPYSLYQYKPDTDSYQLVGMVDAWDKTLSDENPENLPPFPSELDTSGTGFLYYIYPAAGAAEGKPDPVDASVYNEWLNTHLGSASPIELPFMNLTKENIQRIQSGA